MNSTPAQINLKWVRQWMTLLRRDGFKACIEAIDKGLSDQTQTDAAIRFVVAHTGHLDHPSLTDLRRRLAAMAE